VSSTEVLSIYPTQTNSIPRFLSFSITLSAPYISGISMYIPYFIAQIHPMDCSNNYVGQVKVQFTLQCSSCSRCVNCEINSMGVILQLTKVPTFCESGDQEVHYRSLPHSQKPVTSLITITTDPYKFLPYPEPDKLASLSDS
jgi:hypothetical protein